MKREFIKCPNCGIPIVVEIEEHPTTKEVFVKDYYKGGESGE